MLGALIPVLLLTVSTAALAFLTRKSFADLLAPVLFSIMILLYGFYSLDLLPLGRSLVILLLLLPWAAAAFLSFRRGQSLEAWKQIVTAPAFAVYLAATAVFLLFSLNKFVSLMDCLRLWGAYPKILHSDPSLQMGADSPLFVFMQSYPPGMPLLCYFFTSFRPTFSESTLFFTYSYFCFSMLLPFFRDFSWKNRRALTFLFLCVIFLPWMVTGINDDSGFFYSSLFIDIPLGICCGYHLYYAFRRCGNSLLESACMILSCGVLLLLKSTGALFAVFGILGAIVCGFLRRKEKPLGAAFLCALLSMLLLGCLYGSWIHLKQLYQVVENGSVGLRPFPLLSLIRIGFHFFRTPITGFYSVTGSVLFSLPAVLLAIFCTKLLLSRQNPAEKLSVEWADILCQFFCYAVFFLGYCSNFHEDILHQSYPSYIRYMCTLVISALYILTADCLFRHASFLHQLKEEASFVIGNKTKLSALLHSASWVLKAALFLSIAFASVSIFFDFPSRQQPVYARARESAEVLTNAVEEAPADVFLCISGEEANYPMLHHRIYFELLDDNIRIKNYFNASVIASPDFPYGEGEFLNMMVEENYDYVMLTSVDLSILEQFQNLFPDAAPGDTNLVYQVNEAENRLIRIQ